MCPPRFSSCARLVRTLSLALIALLLACAPAPAPQPAASKAQPAAGEPIEIVHATFASHSEFLKDAFAKFEQESGIKVKLALGSTGDRLTKLNAEKGSPSIDAALVPPDEALKLLESGVVEPPNMDLPNIKNLYPAARHSAGYVTSFLAIGLAYHTQQAKPTSWLDLWDPKYKGKIALIGWPNSVATVTLLQAARLHGGSEDNLGPGFEAMKQLLPARIIAQGPAAEPFFVQGDAWIMPEIYGTAFEMKGKGVPIDWVAPKEGAAAGFNVLVVPKGVKNKAAVEKFVDFFLGSDVQLAYARGRRYGPVNMNVQLPPDLAGQIHPTPEEQKTLLSVPWEKFVKMERELSERWNKEILGK